MIWWSWKSKQFAAAAQVAAAAAIALSASSVAAQSLSVLPVNVFLSAGQKTATVSVTNSADKPTTIQIRAFDWSQQNNEEQLNESKNVVVSPPLATIAPAATQVVRLILRESPAGSEATYRIILDQIPGPHEPGVVQMVLRLSIPIFAAPEVKVAPEAQFHLERDGDKLFLVGTNAGKSHETLRDLVLTTANGQKVNVKSMASPYLLAGATRRWELDAEGLTPQTGETLKLTAHGVAGAIEEQVGMAVAPRP